MASQSGILLVEDDPNQVLLLQRALLKAGLDIPVRVAIDGEAAIDYLSGAGEFANRSAHPIPSIILLDLNLPRISGFEVLEFIREKSGLRRLPVIVMSTSREPLDVNRAYDLGANSYVGKPWDFPALVEIVKKLNDYWLKLNEMPEVATG